MCIRDRYVLSELLVCGECGSPYRRVIWTQKGVKRVVWRCQNRLEHGRKMCIRDRYSKADIPEHTQYDTQSLAKFAFSMFWRAMRFAEEQQVPILLDY